MKQLFITSVRDFETDTMGTVTAQEVPMPEPEADEIRIKVAYCSICGSDTHILTGSLGELTEMTRSMLPMPFGHELSGVIDKAGPKAEALGYYPGDKVVANYARYCYSCDMCRSGRPNLCPNVQFCMNGMGEYACYHVTQIHKLPQDYDLLTSALIEPLTIALGVAEQAKFSFGKSVAILGAGGIGLMLVQLARLSGASAVTVFDLVEEKRALALEMGADYAFDPREEGSVAKANACSGGPAYDLSLIHICVYTKDLFTLQESPRLGAGLMEMTDTTFPWTLNYDEMDYVISGRLDILIGGETVSAGPGEVIYIPKGSSIQFSVRGHARFLYFVYPADWQNQA